MFDIEAIRSEKEAAWNKYTAIHTLTVRAVDDYLQDAKDRQNKIAARLKDLTGQLQGVEKSIRVAQVAVADAAVSGDDAMYSSAQEDLAQAEDKHSKIEAMIKSLKNAAVPRNADLYTAVTDAAAAEDRALTAYREQCATLSEVVDGELTALHDLADELSTGTNATRLPVDIGRVQDHYTAAESVADALHLVDEEAQAHESAADHPVRYVQGLAGSHVETWDEARQQYVTSGSYISEARKTHMTLEEHNERKRAANAPKGPAHPPRTVQGPAGSYMEVWNAAKGKYERRNGMGT